MQTREEGRLRLVKLGPLGPFANNTYLVQDRELGDALLIDAPQEGEQALDALAGGRVTQIAVTHRHPDHWVSIDTLKSATGAPVACHEADRGPYGATVDRAIEDGEELVVGELRVRVIHTPGHTPGSVCFLVGDHLISGDTLFPGGPGRTTNPAELQQEIRSIIDRLLVLPGDTLVHPGHGDDGSIAQSKREYAAFASREHPADLCGDVTWEGV